MRGIKLTYDVEDYKKFLVYLKKRIEDKVKKLRMNAGYAGEYGDRGASHSEDLLRVYFYALGKKIPTDWLSIKEEFDEDLKKERDPEYSQYLRLKEKYEKK